MTSLLRKAALPLLFVAAWLAAPMVNAAERSPLPRPTLSASDGEVIVRFKPDSSVMRSHALAARADAATARDTLSRRATAMGARLGRTLTAGASVGERTQVVRAAGVNAATLARELAADPDVEFAEPNGRKRFLAAPNDPLYPAAVRANGPDSGQWYLRAPDATVKSSIDIEAAWARTQGSANVVVAVLDTGVRFDHPDLGRAAQGGRLLPGYDFVSDSEVANDGGGRDNDPSDPGDWTTAAENSNRDGKFFECDPAGTGAAEASGSSWHGTSTASLVGAATNNGLGMAGTAPGVSVLPVRVLGKCFGNDSDIQAAMLWSAGIHVDGVPDNSSPAKVINLSLGGSGACTASYQSVISQVLARNVVIVAAAGNSTGGPVSTPANCSGVVSVLALRHVGTKVGFSDLGPEITIAAPGGNCVNTASNSPCLYPILAATNTGAQGPVSSSWTDGYDITVGTSFSSPLVAGVVGLMFSQAPGLTPAQVRTALQSTARPFPTSGADNGSDPTAVPQCHAPSVNVEQLQCYCNTAQCGAGMLDAGAAVAAVAVTSTVVARITLATAAPTAAPTAGSPVQLTSATSSSSGGNITTWSWLLVDGGGIVSAFGSATNAATATLTPNAAGTFTVRLTVTDGTGSSASADHAVTVAAAPVVVTPADPGGGSTGGGGGGGGGGGAFTAPWLALLGLATGVLLVVRRRESRAAGGQKV